MARKKQSAFARCVFLPYSHRENMPAGSVVYDVSSYADPPWYIFSPVYAHGGIPVPGMPGTVSDTVPPFDTPVALANQAAASVAKDTVQLGVQPFIWVPGAAVKTNAPLVRSRVVELASRNT